MRHGLQKQGETSAGEMLSGGDPGDGALINGAGRRTGRAAAQYRSYKESTYVRLSLSPPPSGRPLSTPPVFLATRNGSS